MNQQGHSIIKNRARLLDRSFERPLALLFFVLLTACSPSGSTPDSISSPQTPAQQGSSSQVTHHQTTLSGTSAPDPSSSPAPSSPHDGVVDGQPTGPSPSPVLLEEQRGEAVDESAIAPSAPELAVGSSDGVSPHLPVFDVSHPSSAVTAESLPRAGLPVYAPMMGGGGALVDSVRAARSTRSRGGFSRRGSLSRGILRESFAARIDGQVNDQENFSGVAHDLPGISEESAPSPRRSGQTVPPPPPPRDGSREGRSERRNSRSHSVAPARRQPLVQIANQVRERDREARSVSPQARWGLSFFGPKFAVPPSKQLEALVRGSRIQEAIWLAIEEGVDQFYIDQLKGGLRGRLLSESYEARLFSGEGVSLKSLVNFKKGIKAIFKRHGGTEFVPYASRRVLTQELLSVYAADAYSEVAAYQLDELYGLNLVPMTLPREIGGHSGSIQYFVDGGRAGLYPRKKYSYGNLMVLDYLAGNRDRHKGNWLYLSDLDRVVAIDHGLAFRDFAGGCILKNHFFAVFGVSGNPCVDLEARLDQEPEFSASFELDSATLAAFERMGATQLDLKWIHPSVIDKILKTSDQEVRVVLESYVQSNYLERVISRVQKLRSFFSHGF